MARIDSGSNSTWLSGQPWAIFLCAVASLAVLFSLGRALLSPLRKVPGPFAARFTDLWYLYKLYRGDFELENLCLHRKYGPIVRLGPNRYSFSHPDALRSIYGPSAANLFPKAPSYRPAAPPDPQKWTLFADEDIQRHAKHRRLYQNTYSMSSLTTYELYVDECTDLFALRLTEVADTGVEMNMGHWFQCLAFDVIGLITYSKRLGFLDNGIDVGSIIKTIDDEMVYFVVTGVYSFMHKLCFPVRNWLAGNKGTGRTYLMNFTKERMVEHRHQSQKVSTEDAEIRGVPLDFLSKFLAKHSAEPSKFTMYHVLAGCASNMVAGSDTTATSLSGVLYHLITNPETLAALRREIEEADDTKVRGSNISWASSQHMPYLQAVIKEALRLHTAVALPMERVVPRGGSTICGQYFPEGTYVGINSWVYHRNQEIFGQDAQDFRPKRWLTSTPEQISFMNRNLLSFGAGARTCIGRHIAALQMAKLIPRLVRDFDFSVCADDSRKNAVWRTKNYFFLKPTNFKVVVEERRP